jgi:predicted acylesterase/phospholipase RssA
MLSLIRIIADEPQYQFLGAETKDKELKVWEAARATSAAPRFFRPFYHKPTNRTFTDGALKHNNPTQVADMETQLLWTHHPCPDILLSISTGSEPGKTPDWHQEDTTQYTRGPVSYARTLSDIAMHQTDQNMDPHRAWSDFSRQHQLKEKDLDKRYIRLNTQFESLTRLDSYDDMETLISKTKEYCERNDIELRNITTRLITSLFYLRLDKVERNENSQSFMCEGK